MLQCWNSDPEERPSFSALEKIMSKMEMKHEVGNLRNRLHILGSKFCTPGDNFKGSLLKRAV